MIIYVTRLYYIEGIVNAIYYITSHEFRIHTPREKDIIIISNGMSLVDLQLPLLKWKQEKHFEKVA